MALELLGPGVRSRLRSGVAITGVAQCVVELVENAIDAGATCIAVRMDIGKFTIQVVDNGRGVLRDDLVRMGSRYMTSKCHSLEELESNLQHMGYRGEALASIIDVSQTVEITSRHRLSQQTHSKIFHNGKPVDVTLNRNHRPSVGTTVSVHGFFYNMPVRRKMISESLELERVRRAVQCIALVNPLISFTIRNDASSQCVLQTYKTSSILNNFAIFFGSDKVVTMEKVAHAHKGFNLSGFISKNGHHSKSLQFVYVNGRIVKKTRLHECVNNLLAGSLIARRVSRQDSVQRRELISPRCAPDKHGMYVIMIECSRTAYDISLEPLKTLIEFERWDDVIKALENLTRNFLVQHNLTLCPVVDTGPTSLTSSVSPLVRPILTCSGGSMHSAVGSNAAHSNTVGRSQRACSEEGDSMSVEVECGTENDDFVSNAASKSESSNESPDEVEDSLTGCSPSGCHSPDDETIPVTAHGSTATTDLDMEITKGCSDQGIPYEDNLVSETIDYNQSTCNTVPTEYFISDNYISNLPSTRCVSEPSFYPLSVCSARYQSGPLRTHFVPKSLAMNSFQSIQRSARSQNQASVPTPHSLYAAALDSTATETPQLSALHENYGGSIPKTQLRSPLQSSSLSSKLSKLGKKGNDVFVANASFQQQSSRFASGIHPLQTSLQCAPAFHSTPVSVTHGLDSNTVQNPQLIDLTIVSQTPDGDTATVCTPSSSLTICSTLPQAVTEYTAPSASVVTSVDVESSSLVSTLQAEATAFTMPSCSSPTHTVLPQAVTEMEFTAPSAYIVTSTATDSLSSPCQDPVGTSPVNTAPLTACCVGTPPPADWPSPDDPLPTPVEMFPFELVQANLDRLSGCAVPPVPAATLEQRQTSVIESDVSNPPINYSTDDDVMSVECCPSASLPSYDGACIQSGVAANTCISSAERYQQYPPVSPSLELYCTAFADEDLAVSKGSDDVIVANAESFPYITTIADLDQDCVKNGSQDSDEHQSEAMPLHVQGRQASSDGDNNSAAHRGDSHQHDQGPRTKSVWKQQVNAKTGRTFYVHSLSGNVRSDKPPDSLLDERDTLDNPVLNNSSDNNSALGDSVLDAPQVLLPDSLREECYHGAQPLTAAPHLTHDFSAFVPRPKQQRMSGPSDKNVSSSAADLSTSVQSMVSEYRESFATDVESKWRNDNELSVVREAVLSAEPSDYVRSLESILETWQNPAFLPGQEDVLNVGFSRQSQGQIRVHNVINRYQFCKEMFADIKVLGQVDNKFIACLMSSSKTSRQDLLVMIDQHAAHERVRLEALTADLYEASPSSKAPHVKSSLVQPPIPVSLQPAERELARLFRKQLEALGVSLVFGGGGGGGVQVCSLPAVFMQREASEVRRGRPTVALAILQDMIVKHLELLQSTSGGSSTLPTAITNILNSQACHGAIKFGDPLSQPECEALIHSLSRCRLPFQCAHGRPALMPILDLGILQKRYPSQERASFPQLSKLLPRL